MSAMATHAVFDLVDGADGRDYPAESDELHRIIRARVPDAASLLDLGGSTGGHLPHLAARFDHVEAVALSAEAAGAAHRQVPAATVHERSSLTELALRRRFDVVTCLNSALAELPLAQLRLAVVAIASALRPGGLVVIEPFWLPEPATRRATGGELRRDGELTIAEVCRGVPRDGAHHLERHLLIADRDGIRHVVQARVLRHFGRREYLGALANAGCGGDYLATALGGRSLVIGVRRE